MNRNNLKTYAPRARRDFIQAMKTRAAYYGITENKITPLQVKGDVAVIGGQEHPQKIAEKRRKLEARIARNGYDQTMEALAYTWFNRFAAIRYMEVNDYLDHGFRVLSHPKGKELPEILEHAEDVDLPGLPGAAVRKLKIEGNRERDIYRMVLVAQCNALNKAMPFLFEKIDDETELLLPDNLLNSDSIVGKLVSQIEEADWRQIEIVGWLYQFYISEKKDQVIGKVVKSEDIPAATQLFTPNWIVRYMVQNSLGAMWLGTYPNSSIKAGMEYFVPPAEQTPEVSAQIAAMTPSEIDPEKITFLDPAVGSGHIVVEAYDLLLAIYMDRGYQRRDAVRSILTKNLFGLDIDDRAAQMAGFALLMKARADDRTILKNPPELNIRAIQDSAGVNSDAIANALLSANAKFELVPAGDLMPETLPQPTLALRRDDTRIRNAIKVIVALFGDAKTFGSLLSVPEAIMASLSDLESLLARPIAGDLFAQQAQTEARDQLAPLVAQARILGRRYDCVVANPPYMGGKGMQPELKAYTAKYYPDGKSDLFAAFMQRGLSLCNDNKYMAMVTMESWMFLSSYEKLRNAILDSSTINNLTHMPYLGKGGTSMGINFGTVASVFRKREVPEYKGHFCYVRYFELDEMGVPLEFPVKNERLTFASVTDFERLPGKPIAYWLSQATYRAFERGTPLSELAPAKQGLATADNNTFVRRWHEVARSAMNTQCKSRNDALESGKKWFPYNKGGDYRKWYGNQEFCVNWENDGSLIRNFTDENGKVRSRPQNVDCYFKASISWSDITSATTAFRYFPEGFIHDVTGMSAFTHDIDTLRGVLAFCNSSIVTELTSALNPTLHFQVGNYQTLPFIRPSNDENHFDFVKKLISIGENDWNSRETSWNFARCPLLDDAFRRNEIAESYSLLRTNWDQMTVEVQTLEESSNLAFIQAYGLAGEIDHTVPINQITLFGNHKHRYSDDGMGESYLQSDTVRELISYAVGCFFGRYSLAEPGLIYAHTGNVDFDASRYGRFPASDDAIIPLLDRDWGMPNDGTTHFENFIETAWSKETLEANLKFVADSLGPNNGEAARDTIRRYLSAGFYKHHLSIYKKRPIYWLFSSGKERAFQCLVYLHRYNETTLPRIRMSYVLPLQGKMKTRIEQLDDDISKVSSTAHRRKLQKEQDDLKKQQVELNIFEEKLRHFTDTPITLDLDDGVKVNYGKFGDLLAEAKAITGGKDDE